jgi:hypothetical protein
MNAPKSAKQINRTLNRVEKVVNKIVPKKIKTKKKKVLPKLKRFTNALGMTDAIVCRSVETLLQTVFSGVTGISRGIALGSQTTALARFHTANTLDVAAGQFLTFAWAPACVTDPNWFVYTNNAVLQSPYLPTSTSLGGPFAVTSPAVSWRVVRASMRLTPISNILSQGGAIVAAYHPNLYNGNPTNVNCTFSFTDNYITNMEYMKTYSGTDSPFFQWFPNDDEIYVENPLHYSSTSSTLSGFVGYIRNNSASPMSYRVEWDIGIEYVPNSAYRPFVQRQLPDVHTDAMYYMNRFISSEWDKLVLTNFSTYTALTEILDHVQHTHLASYQYASQVGIPSYQLPSNEKGYLSKGLDVVMEACETAQYYTGVDVCGKGVSLGAHIAKEVASTAQPRMINY